MGIVNVAIKAVKAFAPVGERAAEGIGKMMRNSPKASSHLGKASQMPSAVLERLNTVGKYLTAEEKQECLNIAMNSRKPINQVLHDIGGFLSKHELGIKAPGTVPGHWAEIEPYYTYTLKTLDGKFIQVRFSNRLIVDSEIKESHIKINWEKPVSALTQFRMCLKGNSAVAIETVEGKTNISIGNLKAKEHSLGRDGAYIINRFE